jgi:alpha-beta hydrolase superfamily lysophospholipase
VPAQVVFIHGLWLHASSWTPWIERFAAAGYEASAPGWPGEPETVEAAREQPDRREAAREGARAGGHRHRRGADQGVLPTPISALRSAFPVLKNPANRNRAVSLTPEQFRYAFGNALSPEESDALHARWAIPAPGKPLFQAATANVTRHSEAEVDTANEQRGPLLLIAGGRDHTVPERVTKATLAQYAGSSAVTDLVELEDRGHSLVIDAGWPAVADACLDWLRRQGL